MCMKSASITRTTTLCGQALTPWQRRPFGLNFESWYQNGFRGKNYDPYSVVVDGQVAANVSVNRTDMIIGGERKHPIQLGTVMTGESHLAGGCDRCLRS